MANNPIKSSDLFQDDGAITDLIKQTVQLKNAINDIVTEAKDLLQQLRRVPQATQGNEEAVKRTNALQRAQIQYKSALSETETEIRRLKTERRSAIRVQNLERKAANSLEGSYDKLSAQYALVKIRLNAMSAAERQATVSGRALESQARKLFAQMNNLQKATGRNVLQVGNYELATRGLRKTLIGLIGTFGVIEGVRFLSRQITEAVALAREARGVQIAFDRIQDSGQILREARQETQGLVSDLDIQRAANLFQQFGIETSRLPTFLRFASEAAAETGQSVEFLTNSIVTGLARESPRIIDNLGISALQLNAELKQTPNFVDAVSNIIDRRLAASGGVLEQAADGATQFNTALQNAQLRFGQLFERDTTGILTSLSNQINRIADGLESLQEALRIARTGLNNFFAPIRQLIREVPFLNTLFERSSGIITRWGRILTTPGITVFADFLIRTGALLSGFGSAISESIKQVREFVDTLASFADIEFNPLNPLATFRSARDVIANATQQLSTGGKDVAEAFREGFRNALRPITEDAQPIFNTTVKQTEDLTKEQLRVLQQSNRDNFRLQQERIKINIEALEEIISNEENSLTRRLTASRNLLEQQRMLLQLQRDFEIQNAQGRADEIERINIRFNQDLLNLERDSTAQRAKINEDSVKTEEQTATRLFKIEEERINLNAAIARGEINNVKRTEAEKTRLRLTAEKNRLLAILKLNDQIGGQLSALQVQQIKNTLSDIDVELSNQETASGGSLDIYDAVGLNLSDEKKQAISESVNFGIQQLQGFLDKRIQVADMAVQKAGEEVDAAQNRLDAEIEARNNGFANEVITARRELELARQTEEEALRDRQKAQRAQETLDTLTQTSSLITASANIWKSLSGLGPFGAALAIAAIAAMFASFAATKIKARSISKESLGEGGYELLQGGSHASGNDIPIGTTTRGRQRTAEGGEGLAVFRKSSVSKYGNMIPEIVNSINSGDFENKYINMFTGYEDIPMAGYDSIDLKDIDSNVRAIRENSGSQEYIDGKGRRIVKYRNLTTIYT